MKKQCLIAGLAALGFASCKKDKIDESWIGAQLSPSTPATFAAVDIAKVGADYVILAAANSGTATTSYLARIEADGQMVWESYYNANGQGYTPERLVLTHDGNLLLGGVSQQKAYIAKVNAASGTTIWEHSLSGTASTATETLKDLSVAADGSIYFTGSTSDVDITKPGYVDNQATDLTDIWTAKFDSDGQLQWTRTYGFTNKDGAIGLSTENSELRVASFSELSTNGVIYNNPQAIKYAPNTGSVQNLANTEGLSAGAFGLKAATWYDGGKCTTIGSDNSAVYLTQFDENLTITQPLVALNFTNLPTVRQITRLNDGSFVLMGNVDNNGQTDVWLAHISASFAVLSEQTFGETTDNEQMGRFSINDLANPAAGFYFSATRQDGATLVLGTGTL